MPCGLDAEDAERLEDVKRDAGEAGRLEDAELDAEEAERLEQNKNSRKSQGCVLQACGHVLSTA